MYDVYVTGYGGALFLRKFDVRDEQTAIDMAIEKLKEYQDEPLHANILCRDPSREYYWFYNEAGKIVRHTRIPAPPAG